MIEYLKKMTCHSVKKFGGGKNLYKNNFIDS